MAGWLMASMLMADGALNGGLAAGQASPSGPDKGATEPDGSLRRFPGGRVVPNLRAGLAPRIAAAAIRADADRQLPAGFRLRDDGEPSVAAVGANSVFRFGLEYRGVRLAASSTYVAIVGRHGTLLSSRLQNVPTAVDATTPTLSGSTAVATATAHARAALGQTGVLSATTPLLEVWTDAQQQGRLCWSLTLSETSAGAVRATTAYRVAAIDTPDVLSWLDVMRYDTIHAQTDVWNLSPQVATVVAPLANATLNGGGASFGLTDDAGNVVGPVNPAGSVVSPLLRGPFARVSSTQAFGPAVTTIGGDETLHFAATTEFALAQTTAFVWTTRTNRWVRERLPFLNTTSTALNQISVFVNEDIPCNAFSTGSSIHFGRATGRCTNTATPTLIAHEFGHSLHVALLQRGAFDGGYSEGFGDAIAALVTEQPCLGVGSIVGSDACVRDATEVTMWPVANQEVHEIGRPYAQFVWALTQSVGFEATTEITLGAALAGPADVPDAITLSFAADDDDGLPGTCSPHQKAMEVAADSRQLPRPPDCRTAGENQAPTARADAFSFVEDEAVRIVDLVGNDTDPDGDPLMVSAVQRGTLGTFDCSPMPCRFQPARDANGSETLTYTVIDGYGGQATATVAIQIAAVDDVLSVSGPGDIVSPEDVPVGVLATVVDPDGPASTLRWFVGANGSAFCAFADPSAASTTLTCTHEGTFPFGVVVTQGGVQTVWPLGQADIANTHPSVIITAPTAGASFAVSGTVNVSATFDDGPTSGSYTCAISWGDDTVTPGTLGAGTCTGSHVYAATATGPREILVGVFDQASEPGIASVSIVITSAPPPTTCVRRPGQTCTAAGIGTLGRQTAFEFTVGIRNAQPIGQMLLLDGTWRFLTVAVRSLSIAGDRATFAGTGSINGRSGFAFEATMADNRRLLGRGAPDAIRVVVRDPSGAIVRVVEGEVTRGDLVVD